MIRRKTIDWPERTHGGESARCCVLCERDIRPGTVAREVMIVNGGSSAVHRDDWDLVDETASDHVGVHLVGPTCARRRVGLTYSRPECNGEDQGKDEHATG